MQPTAISGEPTLRKLSPMSRRPISTRTFNASSMTTSRGALPHELHRSMRSGRSLTGPLLSRLGSAAQSGQAMYIVSMLAKISCAGLTQSFPQQGQSINLWTAGKYFSFSRKTHCGRPKRSERFVNRNDIRTAKVVLDMAQRGIREYDAKRMLAKYLPDYLKDFSYRGEIALVSPDTDLDRLAAESSWLKDKKLVVKPDQLFGKRGKLGLVLLDATWDEAQAYLKENMGSEVVVGGVAGKLTHFLVEPFVPHREEFYVAISSDYDGDNIYFSSEGGICVEEKWDKVVQVRVDVLEGIDRIDLHSNLPSSLGDRLIIVESFIQALYRFYVDLGFAYLEINPFTFDDGSIVPLDLVAKLDDAEVYWQSKKWNGLVFPEPFGRTMSKEELFIKEMDSKTGASLKLTILNPKGKVWTMVAGGGASVIYADTICDLGHAGELANYGEYSGDPNTEETYLYCKTILDLMTREKDPEGKVLMIGGAIANFTDVAKTFKGIVMALKEYQDILRDAGVKIYVRRGGPNYEVGLKLMRELGEMLGVPIEVYGPETHMTRIVPLALGGGE
ncbi:ATP citrate lyase citrate-binding protein [uncultured archaeon]|nr:ATP citrate lyase citrate-binding protein [uncultured archaeon]